LDRIVHLQEGVLRLRELRFDVQEIGLLELLQKTDGRLQRLSTALGLRDSMIEAPHLVDDRLLLRAELLARGFGAHTRQVDAKADPVLLGERLATLAYPMNPKRTGLSSVVVLPGMGPSIG
jgi:hypothetical protein